MAFNKTKALALADKFIAKQNYSKALNELLKVIKVTPNDINLINKIGDLYSKTGSKSNAISYFTKVAESYQNGGFNLKAIAVFKKIIRLDSNFMDARDRLVNLYLQQGHQSEAKGELRQMAEHYHAENLSQRALGCYEKMVEIDPSNLDARIKITEMLVREGRREQATGHFLAMGEELLHKKMVHEAQKIISKGLKINPQNIHLLVLRAQSLIAEGNTDEALRQLTEICERDEGNLNAVKILGRTYLERGQLKDAKACFLRALHISPDETESLEEVARGLIEKGELDEAYAALEPVGEVFEEREEFEEAVRLFRGILYVDENHIPSQKMLARIYEKSKQNANAILALEKIIHHYLHLREKDHCLEFIGKLLRLDPNNLEWRAKLEDLGGDAEMGESGSLENESTDIHVFEDEGVDDLEENDFAVDTGEQSPMASSENMNLEPDDTQTKVANHLTEADVFIKYGLLDKALGHLVAIKERDILNVPANNKLKQLYLDRNDIDNAVGCMVCLINVAIEQKDGVQADELVEEIEIYRPDIAQLQRERLRVSGFDKADQSAQDEPSGSLVFGEAGSQEVVEFRDLSTNDGTADEAAAEFLESSAMEEGWSLDLPSAGVSATGEASDLKELYAADGEDQSEAHEEITGFDLPAVDKKAEAKSEESSLAPDPGPVPELPDVEKAAPEPEPVREHAPLGSDQGSLAGELEEIDFFISVEAFEDARNLIAEARQQFGDHPLILERLQEVDAKTQTIGRGGLSSFPSEKPAQDFEPSEDESESLFELESGTGFFDLAAELSEELFEEDSRDVNDNTSQEEIQSVEELFHEFKRGVDEQIDEADHQTHYDLGIAYKEMGLLEEAIVEFQKAVKDPDRFLECVTMIGNCLIELGRTEESIAHFEKALGQDELGEAHRIAIQYELALAYQGLGELEKALEIFRDIESINPHYRDLESRIEALI